MFQLPSMSWLAAAALGAALLVGGAACAGAEDPGHLGWHLVWSDEFDGAALDASSWTAETGDGSPQNPGWGNAESEYYTSRPENLSIAGNGPQRVLRISARSERYGGRYYTSARIKTQGKRSFQFGRVEARIRLPQGRGMWPAFWMMGDDISSAGWPACGEIDIMEMRGGSDAAIQGTIHWRDGSGDHASSIPGVARLETGVFADAYHVFGVEWNETTLTWTLDGIPYASEDLTAADRDAFRGQRFFLLLNLAVGGRFLGNQIPPIGFTEQSMDVDWVRWYQKD
jgi:beta-glucanase (GH16 family)